MAAIKLAARTASILATVVVLTMTAACGGAGTDSGAAVADADDVATATPTDDAPLSGVAFEVHRDPG